MGKAKWDPAQARQITERLVFSGTLTLAEPAHIGNGENSDLIDMPLLHDALNGAPLLTGDAFGGYLRKTLVQRMIGFRNDVPTAIKQALSAQQDEDHNDEDHNDEASAAIESAPAAKESTGQSGAPSANGTSPNNTTGTPIPLADIELVRTMFGSDRTEETATQGIVISDDALGEIPDGMEVLLREGIKIDQQWGVVQDGKLFEKLCWPPGTTFSFSTEIIITTELQKARNRIVAAMAGLVAGMAREECFIGARKKRGFGLTRLTDLNVCIYDMQKLADARAWLCKEAPASCLSYAAADINEPGQDFEITLCKALGIEDRIPDRRRAVTLRAAFELAPESGLLIGGAEGARIMYVHPDAEEGSPGTEVTPATDRRQVHSPAVENDTIMWHPVVPGSTIGALRSRARQILNTLCDDSVQQHHNAAVTNRAKATELLEKLFGPEMGEQQNETAWASRISMREARLLAVDNERVLQHLGQDRHSMGPLDGALFNANPVFNKDADTSLEKNVQDDQPATANLMLSLSIQNPKHEEIALLLQLLKDLWLGDLALGGDKKEGMGRLWGQHAVLAWTGHQDNNPVITLQRNTTQANNYRAKNGRYAQCPPPTCNKEDITFLSTLQKALVGTFYASPNQSADASN